MEWSSNGWSERILRNSGERAATAKLIAIAILEPLFYFAVTL
jgi:hypothetical protein